NVTGTSNVVQEPNGVTDPNGQIQGSLASSAVGAKSITMVPFQGATQIASPNNTVQVTFNPPPLFLRLTNVPTSVTAGQVVSATVSLYDQNNTLVTDYDGAVALSSDDGRAILPAAYT